MKNFKVRKQQVKPELCNKIIKIQKTQKKLKMSLTVQILKYKGTNKNNYRKENNNKTINIPKDKLNKYTQIRKEQHCLRKNTRKVTRRTRASISLLH